MCRTYLAGEVPVVNHSIGNSKAWTMLTARAIQYDQSGGRGHSTLTPSDVAGMLAGLDRAPYLCGLFVEAGYWDVLYELERQLWRAILDLACEQLWNLPKGPAQCRPLGHLALLELAGPSTPCRPCGESGLVTDRHTGTQKQCTQCLGRGKVPLVSATRADLIGVNRSNWDRVWEDRYKHVFGIPLNWLYEANRHLRTQLRKEEKEVA